MEETSASAQEIDNATSNIKNLSNMPFSGTNIARTIGQGAGSYNNAYSAYILAKGTLPPDLFFCPPIEEPSDLM